MKTHNALQKSSDGAEPKHPYAGDLVSLSDFKIDAKRQTI
jgi:hypothetical protein